MTQVPLHRHTEQLLHKGEHIEIIGEVYKQPIKKTDEIEIYSHIRFINRGIEIAPTRNFADELSYNNLVKNIHFYKKEILKELK